jgi:hypothetical protein
LDTNLFIAIFWILILLVFFTLITIILTVIISFTPVSIVFTVLVTFCFDRSRSVFFTLHTTFS